MRSTDDFEVSVFLTETSSRHSILRKMKTVKTETGRLGTTNGKMTGTREVPVEVGEGLPPGLLNEEDGDEDEDGGVRMADIPSAARLETANVPKEESREDLIVSDHSDEGEGGGDDAQKTHGVDSRGTRRRPMREEDEGGRSDGEENEEEEDDEKKKLGMETTYDGFSIYGRILCLVVKRKGGSTGTGTGTARGKNKEKASGGAGAGGQQAMMEEWITSTQMHEGTMMDE